MNTTDQVLDFIVQFRARHQVLPTVREVQMGVGISSTSVVSYHLSKLIDQGKLERTVPGRPTRSLVPVEAKHA